MFKFFTKNIVGLDIHDYSAQLVEVKENNEHISLEAYNRIIIPPNIINNGEIIKPEELKELLKILFEKANPNPVDCRDIAVVFPSAKVFSHIFAFPINLERDEIYKALPYEAETVIPFSIQDVYWDFTIIAEDEKTKPHASKYVLFAAITKETADKYTSLLESLGLLPTIFGVDVESLKYGMLKQLDPKKSSLVIDISTLSTNYLVINHAVRHFFSEHNGGKHLIESLHHEFQTPIQSLIEQKEKNKFEKKFTEVINNFLTSKYTLGLEIIGDLEKADPTNIIQDVYLTGEFLNLPGFFELAKEKFKNRNIFIGDPKKYLDIISAKFVPLDDKKQAYAYSTYFINAVGIALRGLLTKQNDGINLLPDGLRKTFSKKRHIFYISLSSILMALLSLFIATFTFFNHQNLEFERRKLEIQKSNIDNILFGTRYQEIRDSIISFNSELDELYTIDTSLFSVPDTINSIRKLIPKGIEITKIKFNNIDLTVEINGIADTREILVEANNQLKAATFIKEVITPISNFDDKYKISFTVKLKLEFKQLPKYGTVSSTE